MKPRRIRRGEPTPEQKKSPVVEHITREYRGKSLGFARDRTRKGRPRQ